MKKYILLTFDVEEFDLPRKYGIKIEDRQIYNLSREGTEELLGLLSGYNIKATFFVTALFARNYPNLIRTLGKNHDIGMHGYAHSDIYRDMDQKEISFRLKKAKKILENASGKKIISFRSQRFQEVDFRILNKIGIRVDSSLLPTYIPLSFTYTLGKLKNLFKKRKVFFDRGIVEVPLTVTPLIRMPFLWVTFRNMPLIYAKICTNLSLINNNFVNLVFHPWEFMDISRLRIPFLMRNNTGIGLSKKLEAYIKWAKKKGYEFTTIEDFLNKNKLI